MFFIKCNNGINCINTSAGSNFICYSHIRHSIIMGLRDKQMFFHWILFHHRFIFGSYDMVDAITG